MKIIHESSFSHTVHLFTDLRSMIGSHQIPFFTNNERHGCRLNNISDKDRPRSLQYVASFSSYSQLYLKSQGAFPTIIIPQYNWNITEYYYRVLLFGLILQLIKSFIKYRIQWFLNRCYNNLYLINKIVSVL